MHPLIIEKAARAHIDDLQRNGAKRLSSSRAHRAPKGGIARVLPSVLFVTRLSARFYAEAR